MVVESLKAGLHASICRPDFGKLIYALRFVGLIFFVLFEMLGRKLPRYQESVDCQQIFKNRGRFLKAQSFTYEIRPKIEPTNRSV